MYLVRAFIRAIFLDLRLVVFFQDGLALKIRLEAGHKSGLEVTVQGTSSFNHLNSIKNSYSGQSFSKDSRQRDEAHEINANKEQLRAS